jgi:hypothetical protein
MKKIKYKIAALICGIGLFAISTNVVNAACFDYTSTCKIHALVCGSSISDLYEGFDYVETNICNYHGSYTVVFN